MTNEEIIQRYVVLLISQYTGQTNVQRITFSSTPVAGSYQFTYGTQLSDSVPYYASDAVIAGVISGVSGIASVSVTSGTDDDGYPYLDVIFGVPAVPPTIILGTYGTGFIDSENINVTSVTTGTRVKAAMLIQALSKLNVMNQLPLQVQAGFNLIPTVQTVSFSDVPTTGAFSLAFSVTSTPAQDLTATASIDYDATNQDVENAINAILPSGKCSVTSGSVDRGSIELTFSGVNPGLIVENSNSTGTTLTFSSNLAVGTQLDVLGKYLGITRYGHNPAGPVTLSDSDFYQLILLAIIRNSSGSSLYDIETLLQNFFSGSILVYDYRNMQMSYVVDTDELSSDLLSTFVSQQLLPKPMGVQIALVIGVSNPGALFSFRTYEIASTGSPFNTYDSYSLTAPWVSYSDIVI